MRKAGTERESQPLWFNRSLAEGTAAGGSAAAFDEQQGDVVVELPAGTTIGRGRRRPDKRPDEHWSAWVEFCCANRQNRWADQACLDHRRRVVAGS